MIDDDCAMRDFIRDMESIEPIVRGSYEEALLVALDSVTHYDRLRDDGLVERRYFGSVGTGTFYADSQPENTRWFPDLSPAESMYYLRRDLGEEATEGLEDGCLR